MIYDINESLNLLPGTGTILYENENEDAQERAFVK